MDGVGYGVRSPTSVGRNITRRAEEDGVGGSNGVDGVDGVDGRDGVENGVSPYTDPQK